MNLATLLEISAGAFGDRPALGSLDSSWTYASLLASAQRLAERFSTSDVKNIVFLGSNSPAVWTTLFAAAIANKPFVPLNYRLTDDQLSRLLRRCEPALAVVDDEMAARVTGSSAIQVMTTTEATSIATEVADLPAVEDEGIAVLLFTSGTTGDPKAAVLRHANLTSYVMETVEFMGASEDECALVSVPPYHIAGISAALSSTYMGRRVVQLPAFEARAWVNLARSENVTHAMVVPTMLGRILDVLDEEQSTLPALRHLSYGGGKMPRPTLERALAFLPHVDFVNAYGLTETSSTIAILTPDDHRAAVNGASEEIRARLSSVGRPIAAIELQIRDPDGRPVSAGTVGEIHVRGAQVSGEYLDRSGNAEGWFATRDSGYQDEDGYLFLDGRLDDVIVRGGENISPGEIEAALDEHPAVSQAAVVGFPHTEWGEGIGAFIVLVQDEQVSEKQLQDWVRDRLRSSRRPDRVLFVKELPYNETGKLLRRVLRSELAAETIV